MAMTPACVTLFETHPVAQLLFAVGVDALSYRGERVTEPHPLETTLAATLT